MITAASLKSQTVKDLAKTAKTRGVSGWHSMRKDQLVRAILRTARATTAKRKNVTTRSKSTAGKSTASKSTAAKSTAGKSSGKATKATARSSSKTSKVVRKTTTTKASKLSRRLQRINEERERRKNLATPVVNKRKRRVSARPIPTKPIALGMDRIVLMVRGPYWLHAVWDISRNNVERAKAAMAEHWHGAQPILRVLEVESGFDH